MRVDLKDLHVIARQIRRALKSLVGPFSAWHFIPHACRPGIPKLSDPVEWTSSIKLTLQ